MKTQDGSTGIGDLEEVLWSSIKRRVTPHMLKSDCKVIKAIKQVIELIIVFVARTRQMQKISSANRQSWEKSTN